MLTGILIGAGCITIGVGIGFFLAYFVLRAYKMGVMMTDRMYHEMAPFDEEVINEPLQDYVNEE